MSLPSSPPLLPETELPSRPPHLRIDSSDQLRRKRRLADYDSLSSDPIFSDDTASTSAEDQQACARPKRKRMVKGPWWTLAARSRKPLMDTQTPPQQRRTVKKSGFRNVDSGVWMGSDLSDSSVDSAVSSRARSPSLEISGHAHRLRDAPRDSESVAADYINDCVENCTETVDLSDANLTHISSETIRPLHQLIRLRHVSLSHPPSEEEFMPLTPAIKLFLASNKLTSLPTELFALEHLNVLSLRGNELTSLPPAIGRLKKLEELNIAGNSIRFLPWELLNLLRSRGNQSQISVRPNPLVQPTLISGPSTLPRLQPSSKSEFENLSRYGDTRAYYDERRQKHMRDGTLDFRGELELRLKLGRMLRTQYLQEASRAGKVVVIPSKELIFLACSDVRYFTVNHTLCRSGAAGQSTDLDDIFAAQLEPVTEPPLASGVTSRVPSLFELATRSMQENCYLQDFDKDLYEYMPSPVAAATKKAAEGLEHGNEACSTCSRQFTTARAEWMEFWFNGVASQSELTQESVLPFLRKACSWACAKPTEVGEFAC